MYKLYIHLDTDGDFYHNVHELNDDNPFFIAIYENRVDALNRLSSIYSQLVSSVTSTIDYIDERLNLIRNFTGDLESLYEYDTFGLNFNLGNPSFTIKLTKLELTTLEDGGVRINEPSCDKYVRL